MSARQKNNPSSEVRSRVGKGDRRRSRRAAGVCNPAVAISTAPSLMEIPTIPATMPDWYIYQNNSQHTAKVTLALIDLGVITEEDAALPTVQQSIESGMARWFERVSSGIQYMKPSLTMADSHEQLSLKDYYHEDDNLNRILTELKLASDSVFTFAMGAEKYVEFCVNGKMAEFDKLAPGLYSTALSWLYGAADSCTFMAHPREVKGLCGAVYWMGEDDEKGYLEECYGEDEEDQCPEDIYTKAELEASLTPELLAPQDVLSDEDLASLAEVDGQVGDLARAVLALNGKGWHKKPTFPYALNKHSGCAVATLRNNLEDDTQRILDDFDQYLGESEEATEYTALFFANPTLESVKSALEGIESNCEMLRRMETALLVMAEKTWPE